MGLDMYLYKEKFYSKIREKHYGEKMPSIQNFEDCESITVSGCAAYWRKANQIHRWFVENCGEGVDECQRIYVSKKKLEELLELCKKVLENKDEAEDIMPTQDGFFFGPTEYGEDYFIDLEETVKKLEKILSMPDINEIQFYYQASW